MPKETGAAPANAKTQGKGSSVSLAAFTLVELLVVIGVLAILIAIVLPVQSQARERGRRTTCQSNLRQIASAVQQYVQDNDGRYPPVRSWQEGLQPYLKSRTVFRCIDHPVEWFGEENYTYNARALNVFTPKQPIRGRHEARVPTPATTWLNVDAGLITSDGVYHFGSPVPSPSCGRLFIGSTIHSGGGNYSFADGHVQWLLPEAMAEVDCRNGPPPAPHAE